MMDQPESREKDYSSGKRMRKQFEKLYEQVTKAFENKNDQKETLRRYWKIYNCELSEEQGYTGTSKVFIPAVRDAIEARVTRFANMIHPQAGRSVEVISESGDLPQATMALLEHYVRKAELRLLTPALLRNGDIEGQYSLLVEWKRRARWVTKRVQKPLEIELVEPEEGEDMDGFTIEVSGLDYETMDDEEEIFDEGPEVSIIPAANLAIIPSSIERIEDADVVVIALWLTEDEVKRRIKAGDFEKSAGDDLIENFGAYGASANSPADAAKDRTEDAGVKMDGNRKVALIYQVWSWLKIGDEKRRCVTHFAGQDLILSCRRNPYWSDRVPVISAPVKKVAGTIWGIPSVQPVEKVQYQVNDAVNMALDSAQYSLMPITMTDPEKNPRTGSMVLAMGAIWQTDPNSTEFVDMPQLWKEGMALAQVGKEQIQQSLGTNSAMIPGGSSGKKPSQSEIAQEQQVAIAAASDVVTVIEQSIYDPLLEWFYELDHQFRDDELLVQTFGEMGNQAKMERIPKNQVNKRYVFKWYGSEGMKSAQQIQQQIAFINVLRGIPPQQMGGLTLQLAPILQDMTEKVFGPRLAPQILVDQRHMMTVPPDLENNMLHSGLPVNVHPGDNDVEHMQAHQQLARMAGDPMGIIMAHMQAHQQQMQGKAQAQQGQQQPQQGGQGAGQPRIGATPGQPRNVQQPPGSIHPDQMPMAPARKTLA